MKTGIDTNGKKFNRRKIGHQVDNSNSTIKKLHILYSDPELSDVRLIVGDKTFHAHKLILSISSDVFKTMLTSPTWPEAYTSQISLQEEPECEDVFEDFLQYLYTGRIHLNQMSVLPILILADKYNINDLSDVCISYMCSHYVAPQNRSRVISWLKYTYMCEHKELQTVCEQYITNNFQCVLNTQDFNSISPEMLIKFLKSPEIIVDGEYAVYEKVKTWIDRKISLKEEKENSKNADSALKSVLHHIVSLIKFPMMSKDERNKIDMKLKSTQGMGEDNFCLSLEVDKFIRALNAKGGGDEITKDQESMLSLGSSFQNTLSSHLLSNSSETPSQILQKDGNPRIYTCDTWSTEICVHDMKGLQKGEVLRAFFSTPTAGPDGDDDWHVDFYPKGVVFKRCLMIGLFWNCEIDEVTYDTVRLTVTSNSEEKRQVRISVLIIGQQDGMEYTAKSINRTCYFDSNLLTHNFNDLVDFNDLHCGLSQFLLGSDKNSVKIKIIIRPVVN